MPGSEATVSEDQIAKSIRDLMQVAQSTSKLAKGDDGNNIVHSGTMSDGKPSGGGRPSTSDAGAIETLMIAKMSAAGIPASQIAAFMKDLKDEDEDGENLRAFMGSLQVGDSDPSNIRVPRPSPGGGEQRAAKSQRHDDTLRKALEEFRENPDLADTIDVSLYLDAMTEKLAGMVDGMRKSISDGHVQQNQFNMANAAALVGISKLVKAQGAVINGQRGVIEELGKRLGVVERAPVAQPRGATNQPRAAALAKGLPSEAGGGGELRKSELCSVYSYMHLEKGIHDIRGTRISQIVNDLEAGNVLSQEHHQAALQWLALNPNEAAVARSYQ